MRRIRLHNGLRCQWLLHTVLSWSVLERVLLFNVQSGIILSIWRIILLNVQSWLFLALWRIVLFYVRCQHICGVWRDSVHSMPCRIQLVRREPQPLCMHVSSRLLRNHTRAC